MFRVAPPDVVQLGRCAGRVGNYRRRDFVFVVISCEEFPRLNPVAGPSTLMTVFAHTLLDATWQPDARLARAVGMACGRGESPYRNEAVVVQPLAGITEQGQTREGPGTGIVGRRRKR
jgi:hypothetical protein